jgi:Integrase core domain
LRHDWGPQDRSGHFLGSIAWLGIADDAAFLGEPETNGCAERWIRTLKEQCLWAELHDIVDQLRQGVSGFVDTYNTQWLIGRLGHRTPKEAYQDATTTAAATYHLSRTTAAPGRRRWDQEPSRRTCSKTSMVIATDSAWRTGKPLTDGPEWAPAGTLCLVVLRRELSNSQFRQIVHSLWISQNS